MKEKYLIGGLIGLGFVQLIMIGVVASMYGEDAKLQAQIVDVSKHVDKQFIVCVDDNVALQKKLNLLEADFTSAAKTLAKVDENMNAMCHSLTKLTLKEQPVSAAEAKMIPAVHKPNLNDLEAAAVKEQPPTTKARRWYYLWIY